MIERYVCDCNGNLVNHVDSSFTGDVDVLAKLHVYLDEYCKTLLTQDLVGVDEKSKNRVFSKIEFAKVTILSQMLRIIAVLTSKKESGDGELDKDLFNYALTTICGLSREVEKSVSRREKVLDSVSATDVDSDDYKTTDISTIHSSPHDVFGQVTVETPFINKLERRTIETETMKNIEELLNI